MHTMYIYIQICKRGQFEIVRQIAGPPTRIARASQLGSGSIDFKQAVASLLEHRFVELYIYIYTCIIYIYTCIKKTTCRTLCV